MTYACRRRQICKEKMCRRWKHTIFRHSIFTLGGGGSFCDAESKTLISALDLPPLYSSHLKDKAARITCCLLGLFSLVSLLCRKYRALAHLYLVFPRFKGDQNLTVLSTAVLLHVICIALFRILWATELALNYTSRLAITSNESRYINLNCTTQKN